jgi:hypothetical protein
MKPYYILNIIVIVIFCCTGIAFSDNWKDESGHGRRDRQQQHQLHREEKEYHAHRGDHDDNKRHDAYRHREYKRHPGYHKHPGYSEAPYQKNLHYGHYVHRGHWYEYQGHWKSWKQWDRYVKEHPDIPRHGHYYREDAHLMFRFRDPETGGYFFFSIGR